MNVRAGSRRAYDANARAVAGHGLVIRGSEFPVRRALYQLFTPVGQIVRANASLSHRQYSAIACSPISSATAPGLATQKHRPDYQADLALFDSDIGVVCDERVRAVQHPHVGEVPDRDAEVGIGTICPLLVKLHTATSSDSDRLQELSRTEAGGVHDRVDVSATPIAGDDAVGINGGDRIGDELDVG